MQSYQTFFYNHNGEKLEINNRRKTGKLVNVWKLNTHLKNQWIKEEVEGKQKGILRQMKMESQHIKINGM